MPFALPLLATEKNKLGLTLLVGSLTVALYGIAGEVAVHLEPRILSLTAWDKKIPLVPWTFWIYSSVYFIYLTSCAVQKDLENFSKFLYGYVFAYTVSALFFILFPTTFPREAHPLPSGTGELTAQAFTWFRSIDHPTNCFPSMHVGSCVMSAMPFYRRRPTVFFLFAVWALAISLTTLTTKQHYLVDVVGGAAFGLFCHLLLFKWVPVRAPRHKKRPGFSAGG